MPDPMSTMDSGLPAILPILFVLFLVVGIAGVIWHYRANQKKIESMQATAAANGWQWLGDADQFVDAWPVAPFGTGRGRRVHNCVSGDYRGVPFLAFEYTYYTESTSTDAQGHTTTNRTNHTFDVAVLRLGTRLPNLSLSPESAFARLVDAVTGRDIDLESDEFNHAYRLHCSDRKFAFDVFHARTIEYLLGRGRVAFDLTNGDALLARRSEGLDPTIWGPGDPTTPVEQSGAPLDIVLTVLTAIPDFVWTDHGGKPAVLSRGMR